MSSTCCAVSGSMVVHWSAFWKETFSDLAWNQECIKFIIKSVGEEYQVVKWVKEYQGCGEEYNVKKGKQYHLFYDIEAVGKIIIGKRGKGRTFWGRKSKFKNKGWGRISS